MRTVDASIFLLCASACGQPDPGIPGAAYSTCETDGDCLGDLCLEGPDALHCAERCTLECPAGYACGPHRREGVTTFVCLFEHIADCMPCLSNDDCLHPLLPSASASCAPSLDGAGGFCTSACQADADCRAGSRCVHGEAASYCWREPGKDCP